MPLNNRKTKQTTTTKQQTNKPNPNQTPIELLRTILEQYPWEKYEPPYSSWSYGLNSTTTVLL